ncbi:MAG: hypothetical protein IJQ26_06790 [Lachnospiraceae bacterium]|nr:hypothetical protein [Lachnospiraceae bacterium]
MSFSTETLLRQQNFERLAREAEKVFGVTTALDMALVECKGTNPSDVAGAFDAVQDIAKALVDDLAALAEGVTK